MTDLETLVPGRDRVSGPGQERLLRAVEMPLRDIEYAIEAHLLANAIELPQGTRRFLALVRDGIGDIAARSHRIADEAVRTGARKRPTDPAA